MREAGLVNIPGGDVVLNSLNLGQIIFAPRFRLELQRLGGFGFGGFGNRKFAGFSGHPPTPVRVAENPKRGIEPEMIGSIKPHVTHRSAERQAAIHVRLGPGPEGAVEIFRIGEATFEIRFWVKREDRKGVFSGQ